ncbi:hypothetical protein X874_9970 [Mannheimia varigena USDA-ARS-USMARC-1312]|nr:hypothetical protein X874_9970 [Mannheimia varigena USDA-ARS-USMARC-1312]
MGEVGHLFCLFKFSCEINIAGFMLLSLLVQRKVTETTLGGV